MLHYKIISLSNSGVKLCLTAGSVETELYIDIKHYFDALTNLKQIQIYDNLGLKWIVQFTGPNGYLRVSRKEYSIVIDIDAAFHFINDDPEFTSYWQYYCATNDISEYV